MVSLIMLITAAVVMYFTHREVGEAMLLKEEIVAKNILRMVELNIRGGYSNLLSNKIQTVSRHKNQLKANTAVTSSVIDEYGTLFKKGRLTEKEAKRRALNWIRSANIGDKGVCFIIDHKATVVAHADNSLEGKSIATIKDMEGRLLSDILNNALRYGGAFSVLQLNLSDKEGQSRTLGYFVPSAQWDWIICGAMDISHVTAEADRELNKIIEVLDDDFKKITIAETGFAFIFDSQGSIIIDGRKIKSDYTSATNILTGRKLLTDFMAASRSVVNSMRYIPAESDNREEMVAYVRYFKALDWYLVVTVPLREINQPAKALVTRQSYIIGIIFVISLILAMILVARISKPLNLLAANVKEFSSYDFTSEKKKENPIDRILTRYKDEVGRLAASFLSMKEELKRNVVSLMETTAAKERFESELNVAREIQMGILPKTFPPFPECKDFDLYAVLEPAKEVGGDLYDFFLLDDDHLCFTLGDVSDKGVPAALFMVIARTLIKTSAKKSFSPGGMMMEVNDLLSVDNPRSMFVTLLIGILNIRTGDIRYANGGHNPPIIISKEKGVYFARELSGTVVGAIGGLSYNDLSLRLEPGDAIFLYTDGATEAMNARNSFFSNERLLEEVEAIKEQSTKDIIHGINRKIKTFVGPAPQSDDIAMMMIRFRENDKPPG